MIDSQITVFAGPTLHTPSGIERLDSGTTLGDIIRTTHPAAYVVDYDDPSNSHRSSGFVLKDGCQYTLVLGEASQGYKRRVNSLAEGEAPTKRAKSTPTLISDDKRVYMTSQCRLNVTAVGPHNFDEAFVDLQEVSVAGLETNYSRRFMRPSAKQLLPILDNPQHKICLVEGPPGTGKSSTVWAWACSTSSTCSVRWVHIRILGNFNTVDLEQSKIVRRATGYNLQAAVTDCPCQILILDGITHSKSSMLEPAWSWMQEDASRRIIIVSSLQFDIKSEGISYEGGETFLMPSWTIEEYTEALMDDKFRNLVENNLGDGADLPEKILNKYFLAGGSSRWMFDFGPEEALKHIDNKISRVRDSSLLTKGLCGLRSEATINSLLVVTSDQRCFPVSQYVTRQLARICESSFLREAMKSTLIHNPTFNGWIFEGDFMFQLRMSQNYPAGARDHSIGDLKLFHFDTAHDVSWGKVANKIDFLNESELNNEVLTENTWLVPKRWNQGCYDAVQILADGVRFVQVTLSKSHDLKLRYIVQLLDNLLIRDSIHKVEIALVIPSTATHTDFAVTTTGSLGRYRQFLQPTDNVVWYGLHRTV